MLACSAFILKYRLNILENPSFNLISGHNDLSGMFDLLLYFSGKLNS